MQTVRVRPQPAFLVAGCSAAFGRRCREAVAARQGHVVEIEVRSLRALSVHSRPLGVITLAATYAADPALFQAAAREAGAPLILVPSEEVPQIELEARILAAMFEAEQAKAARRAASA
jgi:hypothetical protein